MSLNFNNNYLHDPVFIPTFSLKYPWSVVFQNFSGWLWSTHRPAHIVERLNSILVVHIKMWSIFYCLTFRLSSILCVPTHSLDKILRSQLQVPELYIFFSLKKFIYLFAYTCLNWGPQDLWSSLQHVWFLVVACGIYFPDRGLNPGPLHWEQGTTGPPEKSLHFHLKCFFSLRDLLETQENI